MKPALNKVIGDHWLSAWKTAPGVVWVQTRSPQFARKLSQRADSRQVACGVAGGQRQKELEEALDITKNQASNKRERGQTSVFSSHTGLHQEA